MLKGEYLDISSYRRTMFLNHILGHESDTSSPPRWRLRETYKRNVSYSSHVFRLSIMLKFKIRMGRLMTNNKNKSSIDRNLVENVVNFELVRVIPCKAVKVIL